MYFSYTPCTLCNKISWISEHLINRDLINLVIKSPHLNPNFSQPPQVRLFSSSQLATALHVLTHLSTALKTQSIIFLVLSYYKCLRQPFSPKPRHTTTRTTTMAEAIAPIIPLHSLSHLINIKLSFVFDFLL